MATLYWPEDLPVPRTERTDQSVTGAETTMMETRRLRSRRRQADPRRLYEVTWTFTLDQYEAFAAFFTDDLENGTLSFRLVVQSLLTEFPFYVHWAYWDCAFLDANYSFARSDNAFEVSAVLHVTVDVPLTLMLDPRIGEGEGPRYLTFTYDNGVPDCRQSFDLELTLLPFAVLQIASSASGPWSDYLNLSSSGTETYGDRVSQRFSNSYGGLSWFRIVFNGVSQTNVVHPLAALLQAPEFVSLVDDVRGPLADSIKGVSATPISYRENPYLQPYEEYVSVTARKEYLRKLSWDGGHQILTLSDPNPPEIGSYIRYTVDGTDPTEDTPANFQREGVPDNVGANRAEFGCIIRARCFNGICRSPVLVILVDCRVQIITQIRATIRSGAALLACDLPRYDPWTGEKVYSGADCGLLRVLHPLISAASVCCGNLSTFALAALSANPAWREVYNIWLKYDTIGWKQSGGSYGWQILSWPYSFDRAGSWDIVPVMFSTLVMPMENDWSTATFDGAMLYGSTIFEPQFPLPIQDPIMGPDQEGSLAEEIMLFYADAIVSQAKAACGRFVDPSGCTRYLKYADVRLSRWNDYADTFTAWSEPEPPPDVPGAELAAHESWEDYISGPIEETSEGCLDGGFGWDGAWAVEDLDPLVARDDFESYTISPDPEDQWDSPWLYDWEDAAHGWSGRWYAPEPERGVVNRDDFESYDAPEIADTDVPDETGSIYTGGTGWASNAVMGGQVGWTIYNQLDFGFVFRDDFEDYEEGEVTETVGYQSSTWFGFWYQEGF